MTLLKQTDSASRRAAGIMKSPRGCPGGVNRHIPAPPPFLILLTISALLTGCGKMGAGDDALLVRDRLLQTKGSASAVDSSATTRSASCDGKAGPPIAVINHRPLLRRDFAQKLLKSRGLLLLQQMMMLEVAKQEVERLGLRVTPADLRREYDMTIQGEQYDGGNPEALTPARREQLIGQWTKTRGVTREELAIAMERQAYLRKIVEGRIKVTEAMVQDEYKRTYCEKVVVRHIQLESQRSYLQIKQKLADGVPFEELVLDYSKNGLSRIRRGLLPPFGAEDPTVPAIFAKVAFQLRPGQVSNPIAYEGSYHVLKLERRIPAEHVPLDKVKEDLRRTLRTRLIAKRMAEVEKHLFLHAKIQITDRRLREQYRQRHQAGLIEGPVLTNP